MRSERSESSAAVLQRVGLEVAGEDLRGEEDLGAVDAAAGEPGAHLGLVAVGAGGVDLPVADLERVAHGLRRVGALDLPRPEAQPRHPRALDLDRLGRLIRCGHAASPTHPARPASRPGALLVFLASRAISSAGRAPPRQGGGHWFEPSIAHRKACMRGPFVVLTDASWRRSLLESRPNGRHGREPPGYVSRFSSPSPHRRLGDLQGAEALERAVDEEDLDRDVGLDVGLGEEGDDVPARELA